MSVDSILPGSSAALRVGRKPVADDMLDKPAGVNAHCIMIIEHLIERIPTKSPFTKLMAGSVITALAISLGMVWILQAFDFSIGPAIPSSVAAIGAALFAARMRH